MTNSYKATLEEQMTDISLMLKLYGLIKDNNKELYAFRTFSTIDDYTWLCALPDQDRYVVNEKFNWLKPTERDKIFLRSEMDQFWYNELVQAKSGEEYRKVNMQQFVSPEYGESVKTDKLKQTLDGKLVTIRRNLFQPH